MTSFPDYLKTYPNMHTSYPLSLKLNQLHNGFRAHRHDFLEFSYVVSGSGCGNDQCVQASYGAGHIHVRASLPGP